MAAQRLFLTRDAEKAGGHYGLYANPPTFNASKGLEAWAIWWPVGEACRYFGAFKDGQVPPECELDYGAMREVVLTPKEIS